MIEEVGCWNCALDGVKSGKTVCQDCGREVAHYCKEYSHEKISHRMDTITRAVQGINEGKRICRARMNEVTE